MYKYWASYVSFNNVFTTKDKYYPNNISKSGVHTLSFGYYFKSNMYTLFAQEDNWVNRVVLHDIFGNSVVLELFKHNNPIADKQSQDLRKYPIYNCLFFKIQKIDYENQQLYLLISDFYDWHDLGSEDMIRIWAKRDEAIRLGYVYNKTGKLNNNSICEIWTKDYKKLKISADNTALYKEDSMSLIYNHEDVIKIRKAADKSAKI